MLFKDYLLNKKPYQDDGVTFLLDRKHAFLFYKAGKGKTFPTIEAMLEVEKLYPNGKFLIMSTADAIKNMWQAEIVPQKCLPKNTELITFTKAIQEETKKRLIKTKFVCIVVDESHKIKANNSQISKLVHLLSKNTEYAFGLTGTPRGNSDLDIFCQFHNMNVGEWGTISYSQFINTCCDLDQKFFGGKSFRVPIGINYRYRIGWEKNISYYSQRVDYETEDEMPELKVNIIKLPFVKTQEYKDAEQGIVKVDDNATTVIKLAAIQKMHQAANGYVYYEEGNEVKIHKFKNNEKDEWLENHCSPYEPTVIVYRFKQDLISLQERFKCFCTEDIAKFKQGKCNLLLLQCSRCESFNLQMCKRIIFYTMDYSYIKYDQMIHRVWRTGQLDNVVIDILLFEGSIENKIWASVSTKQSLADLFMSVKGD